MVSSALALGAAAATLAAVTALGLLYSRGRVDTVEDYVSARNSIGTGATTATLVASSMGAWILLSPAEAGAAFGGLPAVLGYTIGSAIPLLLFVPVGVRIRRLMPEGHSLTEYALVRFGPRMYGYVLTVSVLYMFVFLAAEMTGIAGAMAMLAGVPRWQTAAMVGGFVLVYTAYGGLVATVVTDAVQTLVILPLLAVGLAGALFSLGGTGEVHAEIASANAYLLDPGYAAGVEFGIYVVFAVLGAGMLNQGRWQRIYAAEDDATLRRSLVAAAVMSIPMVLLSGLFGVAASGLGFVDGNASVAFFALVDGAFPEWIALVVVVLAVLLVASSADTMFNAVAGLVTADLARLVDADAQTLSRVGRALTVAVAAGAIGVGAQGYSVLALFLTADLLAAATFVPFLAGLYSTRLTEAGALTSSVVGLAVGVAFFPTLRGPLAAVPGLEAALPAPSFAYAFVGATAVSAVLTLVAIRVADADFDHGGLAREIREIEQPMTDGGTDAVGADATAGTDATDAVGTDAATGADAADAAASEAER
ncbi:Na+/proline symporter [Natronoarchaeum philippinense]|uniref:Na+/proline symporter n=1 Tax=Natronoarchaeum philippinense TaxID=558529 RepID=A0A285NUL2_NATPI|nr:sodium:proline symporter [Natronoarchaeum philippinense]SNZ13129.1 Na+/proline symporter [Natronoarchaeum philippinense]